MTPDEIEKHDKRQSAIHEAGHAVVALARGVIVKAWLERSGTENARFEKTWVGHIQNINGKLDAVVGIAGVVAECLDSEPGLSAEEFVQYWQDEHYIPSPSDLEFMPASWRERLVVVETALGVLTEKWAFLESIVSELVERNHVTSNQMVRLAAPHFTRSKA